MSRLHSLVRRATVTYEGLRVRVEPQALPADGRAQVMRRNRVTIPCVY
eukprot:CAMPEP_0176150502 /NCGR_PEP_ID=MMETSP0120_2-20121206/76841_1 /TAXON_ID=160619 /ORGANISM="Kryptoperidinium foliaceum, Strain CCMP 1326" /LENGTH=47 /DNA_ID= /DNA_START= /DNA_END= /DNA_ORIENTATION=